MVREVLTKQLNGNHFSAPEFLVASYQLQGGRAHQTCDSIKVVEKNGAGQLRGIIEPTSGAPACGAVRPDLLRHAHLPLHLVPA